jgi:hypothetical protein
MTTTEIKIERSKTSWSWALLGRHWVKINGKYMLKRLRIIQTPWFAILLTKIYKPDSERYPHSHQRGAVSFIISGGYTELVYTDSKDLGVNHMRYHGRWSFHTIPLSIAHTITYVEKPLWTLLFAGPMTGEFLFWTPEGKVSYNDYGTVPDK